jgi:hypothetical protein
LFLRPQQAIVGLISCLPGGRNYWPALEQQIWLNPKSGLNEQQLIGEKSLRKLPGS